MKYWASKSNYMTTICILWIWEMGTLGRHAKHTILSRWTVGRPRATTWPQFIYTGFGNWALWADTLSTPYLADGLLGIQEQLHDHNLYTLDLELGTLGRHAKHTVTIFIRWNVGLQRATTWPQFMYTGFGNWALWADTLSTPYLADELLGVQAQLHDHNLYILN